MKAEMKSGPRWTTVKVPVEVRDMIKVIAERTGKAQWQVLIDAVSFYEAWLKSPRVRASASDLDKIAWYITKLATSVGAFKENPSDENWQLLVRRVQELRERLNIDASVILRVAERYKKVKDEQQRKKLRIEMNMAFKQVVKELIALLLA